MDTTTNIAVGGLTLTGLLTAQPLGLSMTEIAVGTCFCIMGVVGRAGVEWAKYAENSGSMKAGQILAWLGGGFVSAPTVSVLYLALLQSFSVKSDSLALFGLIFLGWTGPKGASWLISSVRGILTSKLGNTLPPEDQKP
jgi:hypothetical protein